MYMCIYIALFSLSSLSLLFQASDEAVKRNFIDVLHLSPIKVNAFFIIFFLKLVFRLLSVSM